MYRRDRSVQLGGSSSALYNNLSVLRLPQRQLACFCTVHGPAVNVLSAATDGLGGSQRQLRPPRGGRSPPGSLPRGPAAWCVLPARVLLVLTSQKGVQMYESDGSVMVYWHALDVTEQPQGECRRGSAARSPQTPPCWTSSGTVLVFDIPHKGTNVTVSEVLEEHRHAITDIAAELGQAPCAGVQPGGKEVTEEVTRAPVPSCTCSSVKLWNGVVAAGYGNGQIRLYEAATGVLRAEVNAHARWIYALDLAPLTGKLLSGAEDSFVHVWKLSRNPDTDDVEIEHCHAECVTDTQICGARFCDPEGCSFAVTGYDLSEIFRYSQV
uniref:WD repeat domain 54 n=1 Tax=Anas platyrhynchos TaxID=8839 RepID=A0A8B9T746_ANAPL